MHKAPAVSSPSIDILVPCEGAEPALYENLMSLLRVPYAGPRQVFFLLPDSGDSAYAVALAVVRDAARDLALCSIAVQVICTAPQALENRKVAQLICGLKRSTAEYVVCADSDVCLQDDDLQALLFALEEKSARPVGAAFAAPIEVAGTTLADRASAAVVGGSPQSFLALYGLAAMLGGTPSMAGALCALRKSALLTIGGFEGVRNCLGEDHELAQRFARAGFDVKLSHRPARCHDSARSAWQVITRVARWLTVVRAQRPLLLATYPLLIAATPALSIAAVIVRSPVCIGFTFAVILLRTLLGYSLRRFFGISIRLGTALGEVFLSEGLLWLGFVRAVCSRKIVWRGHSFYVDRGGRMRPA